MNPLTWQNSGQLFVAQNFIKVKIYSVAELRVNKEITPFGGLALFLKMLEKCHFQEQLARCGPPAQGSNRSYDPLQLILGLFAGVWCGTNCFGHLDGVRYDVALYRLLGWKRGADHRAYRRYVHTGCQPAPCSETCSAGSSRSWCLTIIPWISTRRS